MSETTLQLNQLVPAPREKVFAAWTESEQLKKWFSPNPNFQVPVAEVDLKVGGAYRIQMLSPEGKTHTAFGQYLEIRPPEKLVFTWGWEGDPDFPRETRVTVQFLAKGNQTEVVLTHEYLPSANSRDLHREGWTGCLHHLERTYL